MYRPHMGAMGCLLWGSCSDAIHYCVFELTGDTPCIALMDELWGFSCKGPVVMQYFNPNLNSQGTPHVSPFRWAMGCLLWGFYSDSIHYSEFELTSETPIITLTDEPCGVCNFEGPVVMQYINPTLNSQGTPHVSPLRMSHGVSVVRVL